MTSIAKNLREFISYKPSEVVTSHDVSNGKEPFGSIEWVELNKLKLKTVLEINGIQREPQNRDLSRFDNFDHDVFETLTLSDRQSWEETGGYLYILNGGHRVEALRRKINEGDKLFPDGDRTKLPARIIKTRDVDHEGRIYLKINSEYAGLKEKDAFWTLVRLNDDFAVKVNNVVEDNNFVVPKTGETWDKSTKLKPTKINCIKVVKKLYVKTSTGSDLMRGPGHLLGNTLRLLNKIWCGQNKLADGRIVEGMAFLLEKYAYSELINEKQFLDKLTRAAGRNKGKLNPTIILDEASNLSDNNDVWKKMGPRVGKQIDFYYAGQDGLLQSYTGSDVELESKRQERLKKLGQVQS